MTIHFDDEDANKKKATLTIAFVLVVNLNN